MFPFHTLVAASFSGGIAGIAVSPNSTLTPRGLVESDTWAHFRVRALAFRLLPAPAASTNPQAVGFVGGIQDTPPSTSSTIMELIPSAFWANKMTVPTEWVRPPRSDLAGPLPWYKTIPGTVDSTEEAPGAIVLAGGSTENYYLEVRGVFEFKTAVATANTPLAVASRNALRDERLKAFLSQERSQILKILAVQPAPAPVATGPLLTNVK